MDKILHGVPINNAPSDSTKLAMGTGTTPDSTITLANFYRLLMTKLNFFRVTDLFGEIAGNSSATASARVNLNIFSKDEVTTADNLRALKTNVIGKDNTIPYTPVLSYHPATVKYVDNRFRFGTFYFGDIPGAGMPYKTVTFTPAFSDTNFIVLIEQNEKVGNDMSLCEIKPSTKTVNSFEIGFAENQGINQDISFSFTCIHR